MRVILVMVLLLAAVRAQEPGEVRTWIKVILIRETPPEVRKAAHERLEKCDRRVVATALERFPSNGDDSRRIRLLSLRSRFGVEGAADEALKIAGDPTEAWRLRSGALTLLARSESAPPEGTREMATRLLANRKAAVGLRLSAAEVLGRREFANEKSWSALESILLDPEEREPVCQRGCLEILVKTLPLDRLRRLLLRKEVCRHPYPWIRVDVACAIAALEIRDPKAYDLLCEYLVDESPLDKRRQLRSEAWLSLYQLTGFMWGIDKRDLFPQRKPDPLADEREIRDHLLAKGWMRRGITSSAHRAVESLAGDLEHMTAVRRTYESPEVRRRCRGD